MDRVAPGGEAFSVFVFADQFGQVGDVTAAAAAREMSPAFPVSGHGHQAVGAGSSSYRDWSSAFNKSAVSGRARSPSGRGCRQIHATPTIFLVRVQPSGYSNSQRLLRPCRKSAAWRVWISGAAHLAMPLVPGHLERDVELFRVEIVQGLVVVISVPGWAARPRPIAGEGEV